MSFKVLLAQDVSEPGKKLLRDNGYELVLAPDEREETIIKLIADCDAVFSKTLFLNEEMLKAGKKLKVVAKHGVGVDNVVDVNTATKLGLYVVRTPLANMDSVAEHAMLAILALAKQVLAMDKAARRADFEAPLRHEIHDVAGNTLGIVGIGNIGRSLAKKAHMGFDMKIIGYDPYVDKDTLPDYIELKGNLESLLRESDFVSLHLSASEQTKGMINKDTLGMMKPSAFIINFSRGSNVNEDDLYYALSNKRIRGAALDVYEKEPVDPDNPLLTLDNILLSPHSSALTAEAMDRMSYQGAQGIVEVLSGKVPSWCVNYEDVNNR
ncbi:MAG: hydroxyacid dehydrogenase [Christensenellales bacterium]|jgi:D-3-phosphoglycerate dehydrogenase